MIGTILAFSIMCFSLETAISLQLKADDFMLSDAEFAEAGCTKLPRPIQGLIINQHNELTFYHPDTGKAMDTIIFHVVNHAGDKEAFTLAVKANPDKDQKPL